MMMTTSRAWHIVRQCKAGSSDLTYIQDSLNSYGQCHPGHLIEIVPEEPRIGKYSIIGKGLHTCPRPEAGAWLIEGDMSIRSNTAQEEFDATGA